jgi:tryptophan synthase alpha chain
VSLESSLREARDSGRKLLVPYLMGGMTADWLDCLRSIAANGADAVEVGIPFSDPMIDGPVVQEAGGRALERGTTPESVLADIAAADIDVPVVVMTYYNLVFRAGDRRFARRLADSGVQGAILPDLSLEESESWCEEADHAGVATVFLVAPTTPDDRASKICKRSRGFVYGVSTMGVTGERSDLAASATQIASRLKCLTDRPVCIGIGVSTPEQAATICHEADGVIVGSALVRRLLEGEGPDGAGEFVASLRAGIDRAVAGSVDVATAGSDVETGHRP